MPLNKDLREFIECLNSNRVEYVIVGAFAVSWHGFPRYSGDIDFLVRPSATNAALVVRAIEQFGLASLGISVTDMDVPGKVVQIGLEPNRIDRLGRRDPAGVWMVSKRTLSAGLNCCETRKLPADQKISLTRSSCGNRME
jgi:hypothetical protein